MVPSQSLGGGRTKNEVPCHLLGLRLALLIGTRGCFLAARFPSGCVWFVDLGIRAGEGD